jgi:hypothetical protein
MGGDEGEMGEGEKGRQVAALEFSILTAQCASGACVLERGRSAVPSVTV